jgi:dihydrofolate reductase
MGKLVLDISMSLDGFITGPNVDRSKPMGEGGERLHEWLFGLASWRRTHGLAGGEGGTDSDVLEGTLARAGAVLMGKRMFELGEEPWGDEPPFHMPVFVVTHEPRSPIVRKGGTTYNFVTDGLSSALRQAQEAAGDKDVSLAGGANVVQQFLKAGLLDEMQIHVVPVLLGGGTRLFDHVSQQIELECTSVIESPGVTHLRYRVQS